MMETLKDLEIAGHEVVREEAIKWVKEDYKSMKTKRVGMETMIKRWMKRLNIKEEDLKQDETKNTN